MSQLSCSARIGALATARHACCLHAHSTTARGCGGVWVAGGREDGGRSSWLRSESSGEMAKLQECVPGGIRNSWCWLRDHEVSPPTCSSRKNWNGGEWANVCVDVCVCGHVRVCAARKSRLNAEGSSGCNKRGSQPACAGGPASASCTLAA
eukprot:767159-Rhodomonas_salina.1